MKIRKLAPFFIIFSLTIGCVPAKYGNVRNLHTAVGTNLICFGDSLTGGGEVPFGADYPSFLAEELPLPVINAGVAGDTTASAILRLEKDVLSKDPKIVIVELGANDFFRAKNRWKEMNNAFKNLGIIVDKIQEQGAVVVIAGISINYEIEKRYEKLAQKKGAVLVPDIMGGIVEDANLMSDALHPNAKGYKVMAEKFLKILRPLLEEMR